ncbi:nucleotidyl transferase AbiEii/AbiGii toxin family protein [Rhizobium sp. TRM95796]|uniref:nucleotidyl transferase AbiEii/AbiGii toxin family protein n=1 Tax=Rhizobium sp. TRM95796 TaxID=2979862 RepID=UPI0021E7E2CB|nr:nucleotidyl transferase AbiEii/AbiGii toxin family protein [Rhizobium sp. TRM95796]MCV3765587.1 nucleotidyl transferase AbiEii/AbiGii toxin family protein [Rhizobium sp. TRM95796]
MAGPGGLSGGWQDLFLKANDILGRAGFQDRWSFGGGTALMLQIGHRESHDIDVFLPDPQLLAYLDPGKGNIGLVQGLAAYHGDGVRFLKLSFGAAGEIDFIACPDLTSTPNRKLEVLGLSTRVETIGEILAKKVYFRGASLLPRDMFDIAAAWRADRRQVLLALRSFPDEVRRAERAVLAASPEFLHGVIADLAVKPAFEDMRPAAVDLCLEALREAAQ